MRYHDPVSDHLSEVLTAARAVRAIADDLEAVPSQVAAMKRETEGLQNQINFVRSSLQSEQRSFETERRTALEERHHDFLINSGIADDLAAELADVKAKLIALQNEIGARRGEFEALARECNRLERYHPTYPT